MKASPVVAVTSGDPGGIGPEVCLKAARDVGTEDSRLILFGDEAIFDRVGGKLNLPVPAAVKSLDEALRRLGQDDESAVIFDLNAVEADAVAPGVVAASTGKASYDYITAAIDAALEGKVDAVTTGPIHKEALKLAGIEFPGHTEIFAARTGSQRACMMLTSDQLTCSFVTTHVGYQDVPQLLTTERIVDVIELSHDAMLRVRRREPQLAICGLNPHAGENGLFGGGEEEHVIQPAVEIARRRGITITGPLPPDTAFLPARRRETDCVVCMYHDQGHIPLKTLAFDLAVNITLGLPIIRTSVDHGTAFDIAWRGKADARSLIEAIRLAAKLASDGVGQATR